MSEAEGLVLRIHRLQEHFLTLDTCKNRRTAAVPAASPIEARTTVAGPSGSNRIRFLLIRPTRPHSSFTTRAGRSGNNIYECFVSVGVSGVEDDSVIRTGWVGGEPGLASNAKLFNSLPVCVKSRDILAKLSGRC